MNRTWLETGRPVSGENGIDFDQGNPGIMRHSFFMQSARRFPIPVGKSRLGWTAIVLSLVLIASGALHGGGAHAAPNALAGQSMTASDSMKPASEPCDDDISYEVDQGCALATGCASFVTVQQDVVFAPASDGATVRVDVHAFLGVAAVPQAPPPKLTAQV